MECNFQYLSIILSIYFAKLLTLELYSVVDMQQPGDSSTGGAAAANAAAGPSAASGKKPTTKTKKSALKTKRKPSTNKQAGISTRKRSIAWEHFKRLSDEEVSEPTAECLHCGTRFLCGGKVYGTSNMLGHIPKCPIYPLALRNDPKQQVLDFEKKSSGSTLVGSTPHVYDLEACRKAISVFVICDEQPFRVVEGYGFKYMCKRLQPQLLVPSRHTIRRDCMKMYSEEKVRLKALLKSDCVRACITTDCWTSVQNLNYMALTIYFIDND